MQHTRIHIRIAALAAATLLASTSFSQNARVVTANSTDGKIIDVLSFAPPGAMLLNDDALSRVSLQSLVFRDDGAAGIQLLAADRGGQVLYYDQGVGTGQVVLDAALAGNPALPDGLSLDPSLNLYGISSGTNTPGAKDASVWMLLRDAGCPGSSAGCLPGGYVGPVAYVDTAVEATVNVGGVPTLLTADLLEESLVVPNSVASLATGDLLVLSNSPAMLLRYRAADLTTFIAAVAAGNVPAELQPDVFIQPPNASVPADERFPAGASPQGMAFTTTGNLLIGSGNGVVYNYGPDGKRLTNTQGAFVDFATGLGSGEFKVATGYQDAEFRAFVTDRDGNQLLRFRVESDGTGTQTGAVSMFPGEDRVDLDAPIGVATSTASTINTPTGSNVVVSSSNVLWSSAANVIVSGTTSFTEFVFEDPRESEMSVLPNQPLHRSLFLDEVSAFLPAGVEIPPYVRAFPKDDPLSGPPTFILVLVDTSAQVLGEIDHEIDESVVLGYQADCNEPELTQRPRMFWTPTPGEPSIPEGAVFINISTECGIPSPRWGAPSLPLQAEAGSDLGSGDRPAALAFEDLRLSKGKTKSWSMFLVARDTRSLQEVLDSQIDGLGAAFAATTCVQGKTKRLLRILYRAADRFNQKRKSVLTYLSLQIFVSTIESNTGAFANCSLNEGADLTSRAKAAIFTLEEILF